MDVASHKRDEAGMISVSGPGQPRNARRRASGVIVPTLIGNLFDARGNQRQRLIGRPPLDRERPS